MMYLVEIAGEKERTLITDRTFSAEEAEAFCQAVDPAKQCFLRPVTALSYLAGDAPGSAEVTLRVDLACGQAHVPKSRFD